MDLWPISHPIIEVDKDGRSKMDPIFMFGTVVRAQGQEFFIRPDAAICGHTQISQSGCWEIKAHHKDAYFVIDDEVNDKPIFAAEPKRDSQGAPIGPREIYVPYVNTRVYAIVVTEGDEHIVLGWTLEKWYFLVANIIGQRITREREREQRERQEALLRDKTARATMLNGLMSGVSFRQIANNAHRPEQVEESIDQEEVEFAPKPTPTPQESHRSTKRARKDAASAPLKPNGSAVPQHQPQA